MVTYDEMFQENPPKYGTTPITHIFIDKDMLSTNQKCKADVQVMMENVSQLILKESIGSYVKDDIKYGGHSQ